MKQLFFKKLKITQRRGNIFLLLLKSDEICLINIIFFIQIYLYNLFRIFCMVSGVLFSSLFIDVITLIIVGIKRNLGKIFLIRRKKIIKKIKPPKISVIIPAFNEERYVMRAINSLFNQTLLPERVIVVDDCSTDKTLEICKKAKKKYKNLTIVIKKQNKGKAHSIKYVIEKFKLSEITIVLDGDTFLSKDYLKEIIKPFINKRVVISTGVSLPLKARNLSGRIIYHGAVFQYLFFCFRKKAHSLRNSIAVITGDSSAYRTSFLKEIGGFPQGTVTEDIDITWIALERGYRVSFQEKAQARCNDPSNFKGHASQVIRWYSGSIQCLFRHGRNLFKAKPLLFTTIIPIMFDSFVYAPAFLIAAFLFPVFPIFSILFFTADFIFTLCAILFLNWRWVRRLPEIYIIKFLWAIIWIAALFKTTFEYLVGKRYWGGTWKKEEFHARKSNSQKHPIHTHQQSIQQK